MDEPIFRSLQLAFSWIARALRSVAAATAEPVSFRVSKQYNSVPKDSMCEQNLAAEARLKVGNEKSLFGSYIGGLRREASEDASMPS